MDNLCKKCGLLRDDPFGCYGHWFNVPEYGYVPPENFPWEEASYYSGEKLLQFEKRFPTEPKIGSLFPARIHVPLKCLSTSTLEVIYISTAYERKSLWTYIFTFSNKFSKYMDNLFEKIKEK